MMCIVDHRVARYGERQNWGIRTPKPLNRLSPNLAHLITSAISQRMPKFKAIAPVGAQQMGEISLSPGF